MIKKTFLADHIEALERRRREQVPEIWSVSQIEIEISGSSSEVIFAGCREIVLKWINSKSGSLPNRAWAGQSFQLEEVGAPFAAAVSIEQPRYWAARLDDADKEVARRSWITEIGLAPMNASQVLLGTRLLCVSRGDTPAIVPSIPGFIKDVSARFEIMLDGRVINDDPWFLQTEDDVDTFVGFLADSRRRHNVILFSLTRR